MLAVLQQQPLVRFTAASTASFLMLAGCFSGEDLLLGVLGWASALQKHRLDDHQYCNRWISTWYQAPVVCAVVQETSRLVRCRDSPANSVLAGAATGALLYKTHGAMAA